MKRILLITSRNIITTCGELRLIKNRATALKEFYGYQTDFVAYRIRKSSNCDSEKTGGKRVVCKNPIDRGKLIRITKKLILTKKYQCVVLSGAFVYFLIPVIRGIDSACKIVLDIHGTIEECREFKNGSFVKKRLYECLYIYTKWADRKYIPQADAAFVVSHALSDYVKNVSGKTGFRDFIVPCAITDELSLDEYKKSRIEYRKKYGIEDSEKVFVYSGGSSPWQGIAETIELFIKVRDQYQNKCKLILFSGSKKLLEEYRGSEDIIVDSLSPQLVKYALCAGDFGIMLREDLETNHAAFPNKFLEYVGSGLRIITTPYVYDVYNYIKKYNLGEIVEFHIKDAEVKRMVEMLEDVYDLGAHFSRREQLLKDCGFRETLKPFTVFLEGQNE